MLKATREGLFNCYGQKKQTVSECSPYNYRWTLKDANYKKDKGKVFSCFACGGGSTMGYKLAGFDVIGFNEIDPRMARIYIENHKPEFQFIEAIQDFVKWKEFPNELYRLDILDGSPPCSSFSMSGNREKDWGKKKAFREGQAEQILDTLFFDFINLAEELQPKVVIAENVNGILYGSAADYARRILAAFDAAGYAVKEHKLNAADMGVPQRRERVFFIAIRKDLVGYLPSYTSLFSDYPVLDLDFDYSQIRFKDIKTDSLNNASWTDHDQQIWEQRKFGDRSYAQVLERTEGRNSNFNASFVYEHKVVSTIASTEGSKLTLFSEPRRMNTTEMTLAQSFPTDYNFLSEKASDIQYVLGMSVPPVMIANLADCIWNQWNNIFRS